MQSIMAVAADRDTAIEFFPTEVLAKMVPAMQLPGNQVVKGEPGCSAAQFAGTVFPFVCLIVHHSILPDRTPHGAHAIELHNNSAQVRL